MVKYSRKLRKGGDKQNKISTLDVEDSNKHNARIMRKLFSHVKRTKEKDVQPEMIDVMDREKMIEDNDEIITNEKDSRNKNRKKISKQINLNKKAEKKEKRFAKVLDFFGDDLIKESKVDIGGTRKKKSYRRKTKKNNKSRKSRKFRK